MKEPLPLNDEAQAALERARQEAAPRGRSAADAEDLLLALCHPGTVAANVLEVAGVDTGKIRTALEFITDRAFLARQGDQATIDFAREEAFLLDDHAVGSEHLLLGIVRESHRLAAGVLASLDVSLEVARAAVRKVRGEDVNLDRLRPAHSSRETLEPLVGVPVEELTPTEVDLREAMADRYDALEETTLQRVVAIGQAAVATGIVVELIALEVRQGGAILYWKAHLSASRMLDSPVLEVADDVETAYSVFPRGGEGGQRLWQAQEVIFPSPPPGATRMWIAFERFERGPPVAVDGADR